MEIRIGGLVPENLIRELIRILSAGGSLARLDVTTLMKIESDTTATQLLEYCNSDGVLNIKTFSNTQSNDSRLVNWLVENGIQFLIDKSSGALGLSDENWKRMAALYPRPIQPLSFGKELVSVVHLVCIFNSTNPGKTWTIYASAKEHPLDLGKFVASKMHEYGYSSSWQVKVTTEVCSFALSASPRWAICDYLLELRKGYL